MRNLIFLINEIFKDSDNSLKIKDDNTDLPLKTLEHSGIQYSGYRQHLAELEKHNNHIKNIFHHNKNEHKDLTGHLHHVEWDNFDNVGDKESAVKRIKYLSTAAQMHNHYIQNHTKHGDIVYGHPNVGKNDSRSRIYKKFGFSDKNKYGMQFAKVVEHPQNHPEERKRGKKELTPIDPHY